MSRSAASRQSGSTARALESLTFAERIDVPRFIGSKKLLLESTGFKLKDGLKNEVSKIMRIGMKIRWMGSSDDSNLTSGKIYTFFKEENGQCRILEDGDEERFYPLEQFEIVEIRPGAKVRWLGETDFIMLNHNQVYTVLSVEKEWYRVIDNSGEDYLYPPEAFEIVDPG